MGCLKAAWQLSHLVSLSFKDLNSSMQKRKQIFCLLLFYAKSHSHFLLFWLLARIVGFLTVFKEKGHRGMKAFLYPPGNCQNTRKWQGLRNTVSSVFLSWLQLRATQRPPPAACSHAAAARPGPSCCLGSRL